MKTQRRLFDFERLDVYHLAMQFINTARLIIATLPSGYSEERDQLRRAALSILLNLCEGVGEFSPGEKARFYRMSLRSCTEAAAIILVFENDFGSKEIYNQGIEELLRLVAMLTRLAKRADPNPTT